MNEKLLYSMIKYASKSTSAYTDINKMKFKDIPILYKKDIIDNEMNYISDYYLVQLNNGALIKKTTSGSTGDPMFCYWSMMDDIFSNMCVWRYREKWYGITSNDNFLQFYSTLYSGNRFVDDKQDSFIYKNNSMNINKMYITKKNINEIALKIKEFKPVWMMVQPSILHLIVELLDNELLTCFNSVKYVEYTGEFLHDGTYKYIKESLPNITYANLYGATEVGAIALTCPNGHHHIITNNVYIEILDSETLDDVKEGNIVVTGLKNYTMPFIRYWLGDIVAFDDDYFSCGCELPVIKVIAGREGQNIIINNKKISSYFLLYIVENINSEYNNIITKYKLIQESNMEFTVLLSIKPGYISWFQTISDRYTKLLSELLNEDIVCNIILAENDKYKSYKKHQFFESKINL